jgi:pilus assembly protein CpaC
MMSMTRCFKLSLYVAVTALLAGIPGLTQADTRSPAMPPDMQHTADQALPFDRPLPAANSRQAALIARIEAAIRAHSVKKKPVRSAPVSSYADVNSSQELVLPIGGGQLLRLAQPASTVFVADPNIADVQAPMSRAIFVLGKKAGTTTVYALDAAGNPIARRVVTVRLNLDELQSILAQRFPGLHLELKAAPGSLMVSGTVPSAQDIAAVTQTLQPYLSNKEALINQMHLSSPTQVNLRVRIAEVKRTVLEQIGVNWSALGSSGGLFSGRSTFTNGTTAGVGSTTYNLPSNSGFMAVLGNISNGHGGVIDMLDQETLLTTLAEPNLTTVSGETASFLAGGEYPIPVAQSGSSGSNAITVQYKDFGVGLNFTPTVLANDRINLKVRPEVSQIDSNNSITTGGVTIPGLSVRRVETTVELGSGQSFVIGGLLQNNVSDVISKFPGLGSIPILGKLFSSTDYQNSKSELIVIVTPYLVHPTGPGQLQTPLDNTLNPNEVDSLLQRKAKLDPDDTSTPRLAGKAGFVY